MEVLDTLTKIEKGEGPDHLTEKEGEGPDHVPEVLKGEGNVIDEIIHVHQVRIRRDNTTLEDIINVTQLINHHK